MSLIKLTDGMHRGVPDGTYHARELGVASKSALDRVNKSAAHYLAWARGFEEPPTPAMEFGTAFHCAALEPDVFASRYVVEPHFGDCRKKENKAERDAWRAANASKLHVSEDDHAAIVGMGAAVRAHPIAGELLRAAEREVTLKWTDPSTGLVCKSRADAYVQRLATAVDLKTTEDARPESFRRSVANYRYHVQEAFYRLGLAAVGAQVTHFVFVAVEKVPPYAVAVYSLDERAVGVGYEAAQRNMRTLADCLERDEWPGYPPSIQTLELPPWAA